MEAAPAEVKAIVETGTGDGASKKRGRAEKREKHLKKRKQKKLEKKQAQSTKAENEGLVTPEMINETVYTFTPGFRRVEPYQYIFKVFAKLRWQRQGLLDLFMKEFPHLPKSVYEKKINRGDITINGVTVKPTTLIRQHDTITHKVHRHEPPVTSAPIKIITMNDNIVVIDKPASIPVHPCGRYRHNSVTFILAREHQLPNLYGVHRLDRLTSGLLLLARNSIVAGEYGAQISSGKVHKKYLARVRGEFPMDEIIVDQPIKVVNHKQGLNAVSAEGKPCKTVFQRKSFDPESNTSIVYCKPVTGRTHQIRVHLQWLGYPIANDPLYNDDPAVNRLKSFTSDGYAGEDGEDDFGGAIEPTDTTTNTTTDTTVITTNATSSTTVDSPAESTTATTTAITDTTTTIDTTTTTDTTTNSATTDSTTQATNSTTTDTTDSTTPQEFDIRQECLDCKHPKRDPLEAEMILFLHAYEYEGPDWKYETELPSWAM